MKEGLIIIGEKRISKYISSVLYQFNKGRNKVLLRARGRHIPKAFSVANLLTEKYFGITVSEISTGKDNSQDGKKTSFVEITLKKVGKIGNKHKRTSAFKKDKKGRGNQRNKNS